MKNADYIVVGSGCSGAMAAETLVEAGKTVQMIDVGIQNPAYSTATPDDTFINLRRNDPNQYSYLLGKDLEGISWGKVGKGEQLTPPRKHIFKYVGRLLPIDSTAFEPAESLGYGGLGIGWGVGCWEFSEPELRAAGLDLKLMPDAYRTISQRIGISATRDAAANYTLGSLDNYMPSADADRNHQLIANRYAQHKSWFDRQGFVMGRAPLALLTEDRPGRKRYAYKDMDFYSDNDKSAYRPWITIDALRKKGNFSYVSNQLAMSFDESKNSVRVHCLDTETNRTTTFTAKKLVLAAGAMSTARIVLRSSATPKAKLPILCNPYSYTPCVQTAMVGKGAESHKLGFAQMSLFLDEDHDYFDVAMASLYTYQSLMLFRIARQAPLNFADTRTIMQYLAPGLVIMGIHQPDRPNPRKFLHLVPDASSLTGDKLHINYELTAEEQAERVRREKKYITAMHKIGVHAIKRIDPGFGSSIHYAGTLPFSTADKPLTLSAHGQLHGARNVYVADSSGFTYLPAKGLTFSLMANAHLAARSAISHA